jgi:PAS domain S-box-containing protein
MTYIDITERKQAEEALRASEARLARAEQIAHLGSWEMDIASGKAIWSDEFFRICGFEPGAFEPTMEHGLQIIHPDDQTTAVNHVQQALEQRATYDIEKRIVRPDGSIRRVHSVGAVICDEHQQPVTLSGSFLDITARKEAEEALRQSEQRLHHVLRSSPVIIFTSQASGEYGATFVSDNVRRVLGYEPREFTEQSNFWASHIHPDDGSWPLLLQMVHFGSWPLLLQMVHFRRTCAIVHQSIGK